jgi:hypothetical protein
MGVKWLLLNKRRTATPSCISSLPQRRRSCRTDQDALAIEQIRLGPLNEHDMTGLKILSKLEIGNCWVTDYFLVSKFFRNSSGLLIRSVFRELLEML